MFWQAMVKRGGTRGSGARTWYCGWINALFPYYVDYQEKTVENE